MSRIIDDFVDAKLSTIDLDDIVKAYVVSVIKKYVSDVTFERSIIEAYTKARGDFSNVQNVGDWTMWSGIFRVKEFDTFKSSYVFVAQAAYDDCYRLLGRRWPLFRTLSDSFVSIVDNVRSVVWADRRRDEIKN